MDIKELREKIEAGKAQEVELRCIRDSKKQLLYFYCKGDDKVYTWDSELHVWVEQEDK